MPNNATLSIVFPSNQNTYDNYPIDLKKNRINSVGQLRQTIAQRFYLHPKHITILYQQQQIVDDKLLLPDLIQGHSEDQKKSLFVFVTQPPKENNPKAIPINIGGIDVSFVKHLQEERQREQREIEQRQKERQRQERRLKRRQEQGSTNYRQKYSKELMQLKTHMQQIGLQLEENELITHLIETRGNVDRALNQILG